MRFFLSLAVAAITAVGPTTAQGIDPLWHHATLETPGTVPSPTGIISHAEAVRPADVPSALEIALRSNGARVFSPQEAIGNGSFNSVENGLVHGNSGLKCAASHVLKLAETGDPVAQVTLFRVVLYKTNGSDVSCAYINQEQTMLVTVFASSWPETALADHFAWATNIMVDQETPMADQIDVPVMDPSPAAKTNIAESTLAFAYDGVADADGIARREAVWLNKTRGWHIKVRATHITPSMHPLVLGMFIHAIAMENVSLDQGVLSNQLVHHGPVEAFGLARTVSWQPSSRH